MFVGDPGSDAMMSSIVPGFALQPPFLYQATVDDRLPLEVPRQVGLKAGDPSLFLGKPNRALASVEVGWGLVDVVGHVGTLIP